MYSSESEMFIHGIYIGGKALQIEADKSCNFSKTLKNYMRHIVQRSHGRNSCQSSYSL